MIKYSFEDEEEFVAVKENEYDDLTSTSKEAIRTYQEIFHRMDEGWMTSIRRIRSIPYGVLNVWTLSVLYFPVSPYGVFQFMDMAYWTSLEKKSIKLVKYRSSGILYVL
ncbi:hypothetical protein Tco_1126075 [Tanacetum coccineum]